jgi:hypothetical protein
MEEVKYNIYPTLLDAWQWYKNSGEFRSEPEARKELLATINRTKDIDDEEAVQTGKQLQSLVDALIVMKPRERQLSPEAQLGVADKHITGQVLTDLCAPLIGALTNVRVGRTMQTKYGLVELYGVIDYINGPVVYDLKYVKSYEIGKYYHGMQRYVYPYVLAGEGMIAEQFEFRATDLKSIFPESYTVNLEVDELILRKVVEEFIEFVESERTKITDRKLFNVQRYMEEYLNCGVSVRDGICDMSQGPHMAGCSPTPNPI